MSLFWNYNDNTDFQFQFQFQVNFNFQFNSTHKSNFSFKVLPSWSPSSPQRRSAGSQRLRSGQRARPPGPGEVHRKGGVPGRVSVPGPQRPGLQAAPGRRGQVWRHAAAEGIGRGGGASGEELRPEEAGGGRRQEEEEPGRGEPAQVGPAVTAQVCF